MLLQDRDFLFRAMWGAEPWRKWERGQGLGGSCFTRVRDDHRLEQPANRYFAQTYSGQHCETNWFEGNSGQLGEPHHIPTFHQHAPALLGFDEAIDQYCIGKGGGGGHAQACIQSSLNILSLYGDRVPYNICRNFEWQVCAAYGRIPGQGDRRIIFSKAPKSLDFLHSPRLGQCSGWSPIDCRGQNGYATDSIFFLEVCLFSQICSNRAELFTLDVGDEWECDFNDNAYWELSEMLMEPPN